MTLRYNNRQHCVWREENSRTHQPIRSDDRNLKFGVAKMVTRLIPVIVFGLICSCASERPRENGLVNGTHEESADSKVVSGSLKVILSCRGEEFSIQQNTASGEYLGYSGCALDYVYDLKRIVDEVSSEVRFCAGEGESADCLVRINPDPQSPSGYTGTIVHSCINGAARTVVCDWK